MAVAVLGVAVFVLGVVLGNEVLAPCGLGIAVLGLLLPGLAEAEIGKVLRVKAGDRAPDKEFASLLTPELQASLGVTACRMAGDRARADRCVIEAVTRSRLAWQGK